jgi:hypothetical protein
VQRHEAGGRVYGMLVRGRQLVMRLTRIAADTCVLGEVLQGVCRVQRAIVRLP